MFISEIRMSKAAAEILQKFYLQLRGHDKSGDGTPITARQLESLVRLVEARARLELREEITPQDAMVNTYCMIYLVVYFLSPVITPFSSREILTCRLGYKKMFDNGAGKLND